MPQSGKGKKYSFKVNAPGSRFGNPEPEEKSERACIFSTPHDLDDASALTIPTTYLSEHVFGKARCIFEATRTDSILVSFIPPPVATPTPQWSRPGQLHGQRQYLV